jgi:rubrerythrin
MEKKELLQALKKGMLAERDSIELYQKALDDSRDEEVRAFFQDRVEEEKRHYNYLLSYYNDIQEGKELTDYSQEAADVEAEKIFSEQFLRRIGEKQILFSAISTAVLLEKDSLQHYKNLAQDADQPELKSFFNKMGQWETEHYVDVLNIQKEAEKYYWEINDFEPF